LGNLSNLQRLELGSNHLQGAIPPELGALSNLRSLYLENNLFSGPIPSELGNLGNLAVLRLQSNILWGLIPVSVAQLGDPMWVCEIAPPGNEGLFMLSTQPYLDADQDGDGHICGVALPVDPPTMARTLIARVQTMLAETALNDGQANSLVSKLENFLAAFERDRPSAANILGAFINEVEGYIKGGNLSLEEGQALIDVANAIIELID